MRGAVRSATKGRRRARLQLPGRRGARGCWAGLSAWLGRAGEEISAAGLVGWRGKKGLRAETEEGRDGRKFFFFQTNFPKAF